MKKITTFTLLLIISLTFGQKSNLTPQQVENEIQIFTKSQMKNFLLDKEFENVNISSMKKEALEHKTVLSQKQIDVAILNLKKFKLRELFFKKNPAKKSSPLTIKKSSRGVNQLCGDGDFENGLPTVNPYVFRSGILPQYASIANFDTSGNNIPLITAPIGLDNFNSWATLVSPGNDPSISNLARVNNGNRAIKINQSNNNTGPQTEITTMSRDFVVNQDFIDFKYAIGLQNGGHVPVEQTFFSIRLYNLNADDPNQVVSTINVIAQPNDCLLTLGTDNIYKTGWRCARINTSNLINELVRIEFVISDCSLGGHFGTVYIDDICNSNCTTPAFGSIGLDYKDVAICPTTTQTVCGTYQLPIQGQNTGIVLNVLQDGAIVGSMSAPTTITANTFCFNVPVSLFGSNPVGDFEYQVVGSFIRTCTQNFQLDPITVTSVYPIFADVLFWPVKAVNDTLNVSNCSTINTINILANDINVDCPFTATISNVTITQLTTNPNIVLDTTTGIASLVATAPIGSYSINYKITSISDPSLPTSSATITINKTFSPIDPVDDNYTTTTTEKPCTDIVFTKHLLNDKLCNLAVSINLIDVKIISLNLATNSTPIPIINITVDVLTGKITIPASLNLAAGSYVLTYEICQKSLPTNCKAAKILFKVGASTITLAADNFNAAPINNAIGGTTASVLSNDNYNAAAITATSGLTISLVQPVPINASGWITNATISNAGVVTVPANTAPGFYTLTYKVENCLGFKTSTVKVFVSSPIANTTGIRANNFVEKIEFQTDGKIIITGPFSQYNNQDAYHIARLNTDLTLDTSFVGQSNLIGYNYPPHDIKVQTDNKIILIQRPDYSGNNKIMRLNANGSLDTSFNSGGSGYSNTLNIDGVGRCAIQNDGKILIGTSASTISYDRYNGIPVKNIFRLNQNGTLDTTFNTSFSSLVNTSASLTQQRPVRTLAIQPDGKILVSCIISSSLDAVVGRQTSLFRLLPNGSTDSSFAFGTINNVYVPGENNNYINDIEVLPLDGSIVVSGVFSSYNGIPKKNIFKLNSNGSPFTNFLANTVGSDRGILDVLQEQLTTNLYLGGDFTTYNNQPVNRIIKTKNNGNPDNVLPSFNSGIPMTGYPWQGPDAPNNPFWNATRSIVFSLKQQGDGKIVIAGRFDFYNGVYAGNITRINPSIAGNQSRGSTQFNDEENDINFNQENIKVYPNPSTGIFNFDFSNTLQDYSTITVYNLLGEMVYKNDLITKTDNSFDLSFLNSGYYIARISNDNTSIQLKIIKK